MRAVKASATGHKADPRTYQMNLLRDRLRKGLRAVVTKKSSLASQRDWKAIKFLLWDANRRGIDPLSRAYNIDHLHPIHHHDFSTDGGRSKVNQPENVRWLTEKENKSRRDDELTQAEIDEHNALVSAWKSTL